MILADSWRRYLEMDDGEKKCLDDIEKYGCHILHIIAEGDLPPFSYSVGIEKSAGQPVLD